MWEAPSQLDIHRHTWYTRGRAIFTAGAPQSHLPVSARREPSAGGKPTAIASILGQALPRSYAPYGASSRQVSPMPRFKKLPVPGPMSVLRAMSVFGRLCITQKVINNGKSYQQGLSTGVHNPVNLKSQSGAPTEPIGARAGVCVTTSHASYTFADMTSCVSHGAD